MGKEKYQDRSKKDLADLARRKGITTWREMSKEDLVRVLVAADKKGARKPAKAPAVKKPVAARRPKPALAQRRARPQRAAAHDTRNGTYSAEEQVERSKYDVGVATKDLSAKVPKDLPGGYHKDRIVC